MLNKLFKNRFFLSSLQFISLIVFVLIIYGAIGVTTKDADFAKILRNTNLSNLIVWSYWWPLIIVSAIFFGRFWCSICPMEMITSFLGKIGVKRKPGKFMKSGWIITLFYAIILVIGIHTFTIHRIPQYMAIYMLILLAVAIFVGLIWEKRTFCTYVCPIGHLLGLYSLFAFKKLSVVNQDVCKTCKTKDCISKNNHYNFVGRSCTSELYPPKIADNRNCILCGQCFKSCTHDNIVIQKRRFAADLFKDIKFSWAEIWFFVIVSGFVVYEILSEWEVSKQWIMTVPDFINQSLNVSGNWAGTIKAIILFMIFPAVFYFLFAWIKKILTNESIKNSISKLVLAILPITASMHLLKALFKTSSRIPYWSFSVSDPAGIETASKIIKNKELLNNVFLSEVITPVLNVIAVLLLVSSLILSFFVIKKHKFL
ncbi:MAG: 4Fe-4S binding protein [Bacteroidota bacterium]|nr:4Fe-4S binding protein [Bacteroidota bacterium]